MDHEDTYFTPEAIDEQIDRLRNETHPAIPPSPDARLLQDLRSLHRTDENRLEQIWERLAAQSPHHKQMQMLDKPPVDIQYYQQRKLQNQRQGQQQGRMQDWQPIPGVEQPARRRASLLLTQLVAVLIIGSLLLIPTLIGYQQTSAPGLPQQVQPAPATHSVYLSNDLGVMGVDASSGRGRWTYTVPDYSLGLPVNPIVGNGIVYAESQDSIYAIDANTGLRRWSQTFQSQLSPYPTNKSRPVLYKNAIYVSVVFMEVKKLDAANGKILQTYRPQLNTNIVSIAVENNILYAFGLFDICALRLSDGKQLWYRQLNQSQVLGIPHVVNGVLYTIASSDVNWPYVDPQSTSHIEAFEAASGNHLWESSTIQGSAMDINIVDGTIYNASTDGSVSAYDAKTGAQIWMKTIAGMGFSGNTAPQVEAGIIYMAAQAPTASYRSTGIVALDAANGHLKWQYPSEPALMKRTGHMFRPPVVQNGVIYVNDAMSGQYTSEVYALFGGAVLWHRTINNKS
ncbi:MAG: hypothetical protein PVS3B1_03500 [Ktedonobacteraceae bacterium]